MRRILLLVGVVLLIGFSASFAQQNSKPTAEAVPAAIPAEASAKVNPVKPTVEGLADAKKLYGYHCSMCHGNDVEQIAVRHFRNAAGIAPIVQRQLHLLRQVTLAISIFSMTHAAMISIQFLRLR